MRITFYIDFQIFSQLCWCKSKVQMVLMRNWHPNVRKLNFLCSICSWDLEGCCLNMQKTLIHEQKQIRMFSRELQLESMRSRKCLSNGQMIKKNPFTIPLARFSPLQKATINKCAFQFLIFILAQKSKIRMHSPGCLVFFYCNFKKALPTLLCYGEQHSPILFSAETKIVWCFCGQRD